MSVSQMHKVIYAEIGGQLSLSQQALLEDVFRVHIPNAKSRTHGNTVLEHTFARIMDHPDATHVRILHVEKRTQRKGVPTDTISMSMKPP
jgi:hypothetical protein